MGKIPQPIKFYIGLSDRGNNTLFSETKIREDVFDIVSSTLGKLGINCELQPPGGRGAGMEQFAPIMDAIKWAISNKDLIQLGFALLNGIIYLPKQIDQWAMKKNLVTQPRIGISLGMDLEWDFQRSEDFNAHLASIKELISLRNIVDIIDQAVHREYPQFAIDYWFDLSISPKHFSVSYFIDSEHLSPFSKFRLIRLIKGLRIWEGRQIRYSFDKFGLIKRIDCPAKGRTKQYYYLLSTRNISDYL